MDLETGGLYVPLSGADKMQELRANKWGILMKVLFINVSSTYNDRPFLVG